MILPGCFLYLLAAKGERSSRWDWAGERLQDGSLVQHNDHDAIVRPAPPHYPVGQVQHPWRTERGRQGCSSCCSTFFWDLDLFCETNYPGSSSIKRIESICSNGRAWRERRQQVHLIGGSRSKNWSRHEHRGCDADAHMCFTRKSTWLSDFLYTINYPFKLKLTSLLITLTELFAITLQNMR